METTTTEWTLYFGANLTQPEIEEFSQLSAGPMFHALKRSGRIRLSVKAMLNLKGRQRVNV